MLAAEPALHRVPVCDLYVVGDGVAAFALAAEGRRAGLSVQQELAGRSVKGALKQAVRLQATYAAVTDDAGDAIQLQHLQTGEQTVAPGATAVVARVLKGRHPT